MQLITLIPILAFLGIFIHVSSSSNTNKPPDVFFAFVSGSILWGVAAVISTEVLTLVNGITRWSLALFWFFFSLLVWYRINLSQFIKDSIANGRNWVKPFDRGEWVMVGYVLIVMLIQSFVAFMSPPNNVDSLLYHMSRVAHWTQNQSLAHYPTTYEHQLFMPIWAETAIMHFQVLYGSDQVANLVQWFSFLGCAIILAGIVGILGGKRKAQLSASVVVCTLPMGLLQSTSTQNDLVVAYWLSCLMYLLLLIWRDGVSVRKLALIGAAAGLGMLTKLTFYLYALPASVWLIWIIMRRSETWKVLPRFGIPLIAILMINSGFWFRNLQTYGTPFGPLDIVRRYTIEDVELHATEDDDLSSTSNNGTPTSGSETELVEIVNKRITQFNRMVLWNIAVPLTPLRYRVPIINPFLQSILSGDQYADLDSALWNHEDRAGNPVHILLVGISLVIFSIQLIRKRVNHGIMIYIILVLLGYVLLPVVLNHAASLDGTRFQLPFFVLATPFIIRAIFRDNQTWIQQILLGVLILFSLPWLLFNNIRPVIGWQPWITRVGSVVLTDDTELIFAMQQGAQDEYQAIAQEIYELDCRNIGLFMDSSDYEYLFWHLLGAPNSEIRIESLNAAQYSMQYVDREFHPCAVICTICQSERRKFGLEQRLDYSSVNLYVSR
jgi:4-amino-4-deoxy-L-arabinose transferase-like glycosyltransferase